MVSQVCYILSKNTKRLSIILLFISLLYYRPITGEPIHNLIQSVVKGIVDPIKGNNNNNSSSTEQSQQSPSPGSQGGKDYVSETEEGALTPKNNSIAQAIDKALKKEFKKEETDEKNQEGEEFNKTVQNKDAQIETVVRLTHNHRPQNNNTQNQNSNTANQQQNYSQQQQQQQQQNNNNNDDNNNNNGIEDIENQAVDTIIDKKDNIFVISTPSTWNALTLDPQFVQDLTIVFSASALGGSIFEMLRQPAVSGYLVAGSVIGPGGLQLIKELVQVESLAQIGIQLLLFGLGLEFSIKKLWPVKYVAIFGGILQILTFIFFGGVGAFFAGGKISEGILIGAIISMSSTSILVKLFDANPRFNFQPFKQIVVGTLILQDCMVGLLFALIPILGDITSPSPSPQGGDRATKIVTALIFKLLLSLIFVWFIGKYLFRIILPIFKKFASVELFQLILIGWCMLGAWIGGILGISQELGAFLAGSILSGNEESHFIEETTQQIRNIFVGLFISSIGLIMSPLFLWRHIVILGFGTIIVISIKTLLVSSVIIFFQYNFFIGFAVGTCLAQIGEFAFVLLGIGLQLQLISQGVYLLMLGVTALSILITPLVLKITYYLLGSKSIVAYQQFEQQEPGLLPQKNIDAFLERINSGQSIGGEGSGSEGTAYEGSTYSTRNRKSANK